MIKPAVNLAIVVKMPKMRFNIITRPTRGVKIFAEGLESPIGSA